MFLRTRHRSASSLRALLLRLALAESLRALTGEDHLSFYDAAAPIVYADSLDYDVVFGQSRYEEGVGDYLNAPFNKEEYEAFAQELIDARCVIKKEFESSDLFQACQPIEEIARKGFDAPRFGPLKPVRTRGSAHTETPLGGGAIACRG